MITWKEPLDFVYRRRTRKKNEWKIEVDLIASHQNQTRHTHNSSLVLLTMSAYQIVQMKVHVYDDEFVDQGEVPNRRAADHIFFFLLRYLLKKM